MSSVSLGSDICRWLATAVLLTVALTTASCGRSNPLSADPTIANRQANVLLPHGITETRARAVLQERGFQISHLTSDKPSRHLLVGTCHNDHKTWLVGVVIIDGHVAACSVTISDQP